MRRFLGRPASNEPLVYQVRRFCGELERHSGIQDWQVRQADQSLRIYFVNFLKRPDWQKRPEADAVASDTTHPLTALDLLRTRWPWDACSSKALLGGRVAAATTAEHRYALDPL